MVSYKSIHRRAFNVLRLVCCDLEKREVLERFSDLLAQVKFIELSEIKYMGFQHNRDLAFEYINMSKTNIGTIAIKKGSDFGDKNRIVVSLLIQETQIFYIYSRLCYYERLCIQTNKEGISLQRS